MAINIDAKVAIELAKKFLEDYHDSFSLISTTLEEDVWTVVCDIGFLKEKIKEVKVDASSGQILGFIDVQRESIKLKTTQTDSHP